MVLRLLQKRPTVVIKRVKKYLSATPRAVHYYGGMLSFLRAVFFRTLLHGYEGLKKLYSPFLNPSKIDHKPSPHYSENFQSEVQYVIWAPEYGENSAGVRCLYILCDQLNKRGLVAVIAGSRLGPDHLNAPIVSQARAKTAVSNGAIAVYPETISGNPLGARYIARWVLNKPGWISGDRIFSKDETVFYYAEGYRQSIQNDIAGKLYLPTLDESIFFDDHVPITNRNLECYYVGKSQFKPGLFDVSKTFEITRQYPPRAELGKLLRASKVLYCFDNSTALTYEAIMCGCPVVIIPDGTQQKADYVNGELGADGIAWGLEEYRQLKPEPEKMLKRYQQLKIEFQQQLSEFIRITQQKKSKNC